jgi:hypothetical protein
VATVAGFAVVVTAAIAFSGQDGGGVRPSGAVPPPVAGAPRPSPSPSTPGGSATGQPQPDGGLVYQGMRLPAGDGLSLHDDPPAVSSGQYSGDLGFAADATAFTADSGRDTLTLVDAKSPATAATCQSAGPGGTAWIATSALAGGARLCVRSADGSVTALVTFRQVPDRQTPRPSAVLDLTVWRGAVSRSAPGDQFRTNFADGVARSGWSRVY